MFSYHSLSIIIYFITLVVITEVQAAGENKYIFKITRFSKKKKSKTNISNVILLYSYLTRNNRGVCFDKVFYKVVYIKKKSKCL